MFLEEDTYKTSLMTDFTFKMVIALIARECMKTQNPKQAADEVVNSWKKSVLNQSKDEAEKRESLSNSSDMTDIILGRMLPDGEEIRVTVAKNVEEVGEYIKMTIHTVIDAQPT